MSRPLIAFIMCIIMLIFNGCSNDQTAKNEKLSLLEKINKKGKVVIGTDASFAPFEFIENGKIVGYGPDILAEINKNWKVEMEQIDTEWKGILPGLEAKKFDFIATAVTVTPERKEKFLLTTPIADSTLLIVINKDYDGITKEEDIAGKTIGCSLASSTEKQLLKYNEQLKVEGKPEIILKTYSNYPNMLFDLENRRLDGIIADGVLLKAASKNDLEQFKIVDKFKESKYMSWAVRKEDEDLLIFLNEELLKLKKSGKLAELQEKWFGAAVDLPNELP